MTDDAEKKKALKAIRKAAREGRITHADQDRISEIPDDLISRFLETVFDVKGALLTDESQLYDFVSYGFNPAERAKAKDDACTRIFELYGVRCKPDDYVWEVLQRIMDVDF